ncbi:unnamed protein product, partial [Symbiodinium pilosum]
MSQDNLLEQLLKMEDLFKKYEQAANKPVFEEVKSALLLRVLPQNVKSHLTVSINESTMNLRMIRCLAPMDVDRVKGKWDKDKGKGKYNSGMVQHYDLHMNDGEQEVIECPLSACEVHDLTMFDAYEADQAWVSSAQ